MTAVLTIGIILPLCTQAAFTGGDDLSLPSSARQDSDHCGGHQDSGQRSTASDCLTHCLSSKGPVGEQQIAASECSAVAWSIAADLPRGPETFSTENSDDHILRMLLYDRLSGVIMRN